MAILFSAALVLASLTGTTAALGASPSEITTLEETPRPTSTIEAPPDTGSNDDGADHATSNDDGADHATSAAPVQPEPLQEATTQAADEDENDDKSSTSPSPDATEASEEAEVEPEETEATITVRVGSDRRGGNVAGLAGATLRLYTGSGAVQEPWARCTSNSAGQCSFTIPDTHPATDDYEQGENYDKRFWVRQDGAPSGWYANKTLGVSGGGDYKFQTGSQLRAGNTYTSTSDFMRTAGSTGTWQNSRANPPASLSCRPGSDIALVRSGSGGGQFHTAARAMKKRLAGSNSTVTVFDGGLGQVASSSKSFDLTIVVGAGATAKNFAEIEQTIASANTVKAQGSRILAVNVGAGNAANLKAIAGPQTSGSISYTGADVHQVGGGQLSALLGSIADQAACETTVKVTQKVTKYGQDPAVAGTGWTFTLDSADVQARPEATQQTGKNGTVTYELDFAKGSGQADISIASKLTDQQRDDGWALDDITCQINDDNASTGDTVAKLSVAPGDRVECTFHAVQTLNPGLTITKQAWDTPNIGGLAAAPEVVSGSSVPAGKVVTWTYRVTNTGETPLDEVVVTDSQLPDDAVDCPSRTLGAGKSMTCTASGAVTADH